MSSVTAISGLFGCVLGLLVQLAHAEDQPTRPLTIGEITVMAEVVDTPSLRAHGLMGRTSLEPDHGMLFVYPDAQIRSFWMKDTLLALSIVFPDEGGLVVHMAEMQPMDTTTTLSQQPAVYALEMEGGWFTQHGVKLGDKVDALPPPSRR